VILAVCCTVAVGVELAAPAEVNWRESYTRVHEWPYGCRILYEELPALFPEAPVEARSAAPYVALRDAGSAPLNYLFVTATFSPDALTAEALLQSARQGNAIFVAAGRFEGALADSLGLSMAMGSSATLSPSVDSTTFAFTNPPLRRDRPYVFRERIWNRAFAAFDSSRATVLGTNGPRANFVRVSVGEGAFFLHAAPRAFTNYHLLRSDHAEYAARALSHLPVRRTWWDAHYKPLRTASSNPLRYVFGEPALRGAWYVLILGVVLFMLFESKRRQRPIPTVEPPENKTLDFARTVGHLYFEHGDHADLAHKKVRYLNDFLRRRLRLESAGGEAWSDDFARRVAARSGASLETVRALAETLRSIRGRDELLAETLMTLSRRIEQLYAESEVHPARREKPGLPSG
jgi:hypothetical protein